MSNKKKHLVIIVNPKSGVEREKEIKNAVYDHLDHEQYSYEIIHTKYAKHGIELAAGAAKQGAYAVVAVGGDGSINDIITGLTGTNTVLAIIPKGSGNGMARTMHIPLHTEEAIKIINKGNIVKMDVAFANGQAYISNAGVAFDALIAKKFAKSEKRGFRVYSWLVTKHMWTYKEWEWKIIIDGKEINEKAFIVNVANGQQFGYNFKIAPSASYTDGLLDIVIVRSFPKIFGGALVLRLVNGSITKSLFVKHYKGKEITVSHPGLNLMQTDGDAHACDNKVKFTIKPGAQKVLVP
jgi:diacylglycerol kinase (ATP)